FVISLEGPSLELKDAPDVRAAPQGTSLEACAWTSRGVYRPGEEVRYTALVRNKDLSATDLKALALRITRPDGTAVKTLTLDAKGAGFFEGSYTLPEEGERGAWTFTLRSGERTDLAHTTIMTADFVPASLEAEIKGSPTLKAGSDAAFTVATRYTYGAPGAGAKVSMMLTLAPDPHPEAGFKDFTFGPDQKIYPSLTRASPFDPMDALADGTATFKASLGAEPYAQTAKLDANAFAQGSETNASRTFKVAPATPIVGFRSTQGGFDAVIVKDGKAVAGSAGYAIFKVQTDYQYVFDRGEWKYLENERLSPVLAGTVQTHDGKIASVSADLEDGAYLARLQSGSSVTEARFFKGHEASAQANSPETFEVASDKDSYAPDEKATLTFDAREDGGADLLVGSREIKLMRRYEVHKGTNQISFRIPKDAAGSERALITLTSPAGNSASPRSMGLALLTINSQDKVLGAALKTPDAVKPGSTLEAELDVTGAGEGAMCTAALVDTGVLALTSYAAPAPEREFLKPLAYGIQAYDRYGALLHAFAPQGQGHGEMASALMKNAMAPQALSALRGKVVALYSGMSKVEGGKASFSFKIPDSFQGGLRLMAVAADGKAVGSAFSDIAVRDAAAPSVSLPAIMHDGDAVTGAVSVQNTSGADGQKLSLSAKCSGAIKCDEAKASLNLKDGEMASVPLKAKAVAEGEGKVSLELSGGSLSIARSYSVHVATPDPMVLASDAAYIQEGQSKLLEPKPALDGSPRAELARGLIPGGSKDDLLRQIKDAPYISPADLPSVVMALADLPRDGTDGAAVQDLVSLLQARAGNGSSFEDPALSALESAALLRARQAGFDVSDELCDRLILELKRNSGQKDPSGPISMLALSMIHEGDLSDLRYSFDNTLSPSPLSCAAYAAAFHGYGDNERAQEALKAGFKALDTLDTLHNALSRAATTDQAIKAFDALSRFEPTVLSDPQFDRAALIAAAAMTRNAAFINSAAISSFRIPDLRTLAVLARASEAAGGRASAKEVETGAGGSYKAVNDGKGGAFYTLSAFGTPKKGAALSRSVSARLGFYDISDLSDPALASSLKRGVSAMMLLTIKRDVPHNAQAMVRFALPAGFTFVDTVNSDGALGKSSGVIDCQAEAGDSGVVLKAWPSSTDFKLGIIVRPQFEGTFKAPAATYDEDGALSSQIIRESSEVVVRDGGQQKAR
ncbi:MAG: MG2 domain-containing protein, partial [Succinivibrio sp.]